MIKYDPDYYTKVNGPNTLKEDVRLAIMKWHPANPDRGSNTCSLCERYRYRGGCEVCVLKKHWEIDCNFKNSLWFIYDDLRFGRVPGDKEIIADIIFNDLCEIYEGIGGGQ